MKIQNIHEASATGMQAATSRQTIETDFSAILATAKAAPTPDPSTENARKKTPPPCMTAAEELEEYLKKTPAQHLREAILKEMGLTEEELDAMPPERRAVIEHTILEKIKERLQEHAGRKQRPEQSSVAMLSLLTRGLASPEPPATTETSPFAPGKPLGGG